MKSLIKNILQKILGMETYLYVFSIFIIRTLRYNKREGDFCFFIKQIPEGGILLDVGANIGVMTYYMAKQFPNSKVYSFEPVPLNLKTLHKIVNRYKLANVEICNYALGNENGEVDIVMPELQHVKMQGLSHIVHESIPDMNEGEKFKTKIKKLDDLSFLQNSKEKISAIKLDVENFEYFVLKGGEDLLKKHHPMLYSELWDNENRTQCFTLMTSLGYKTKVLVDNQLVAFDEKIHKTQNFFFVV